MDSKLKSAHISKETGLGKVQSNEEIERELQDKLASLGINLSSENTSVSNSRATQVVSPVSDKRTTILDIGELRNALRQQISIAEIKKEIEKTIRTIIIGAPVVSGETQELEIRAAALMLPYCREYIPDFPADVRPSEFAIDLNLQDIIDFHYETNDLGQDDIDELVEQYAVQIIQTLLTHPLIPQKDAKRIGVDLKTTALKDERGTALYSNGDAQFLEVIFGEKYLMDRGGEIGLLAILISAKKWNKIDSDNLFNTAVQYTLEAMAKKRAVTSIILRGHGDDHPVAYILAEYIAHSLDQSLEVIINFIEGLLNIVRDAIQAPAEEFITFVYQNYLPKLKVIFRDKIHDSFDRFIETFRREFQKSQQTIRSKIFFLKRIGDLCEVSFYCYEAISALESASGEVYAKEKLDEGTKHFAVRNNIPLDETNDILSQKNTLSELLMFTLKQRCANRDIKVRSHFISKLMNDMLFFIDSLRRVFDHSYAQGRVSASSDYSLWEEVVADCSRGYLRLFFGRNLSDIERYSFETIYKRLVEQHLSFFDLQTPMLFQSVDFKFEKFAKSKSSEDNLKEHFLKFFIALHKELLNFDISKEEGNSNDHSLDALLKRLESNPAATPANNTAAFTFESVQARAFLAQSDMPLSDYSIEALSMAITPDVKDKNILLQALRAAVELSAKARILEEIQALKNFLQNLRQRVSLLIGLTEMEKEQWRSSIAASLKDLEQNDPIAISCYMVIISGIEDWDISQERVLEEWKNPETTILRIQQIFFILLLKQTRATSLALATQYQQWLSASALPAESARRRTFERREHLINLFTRQSGWRAASMRSILKMVNYIQLSYEITNWLPNEAYIIEDLLAVETSNKRIREITTILTTFPPENVRSLIDKFTKILTERVQQSASGYSYYTDEERALMERRGRQFEALSQRSAWQTKTDQLIFSLSRLLVKPIKNFTESRK